MERKESIIKSNHASTRRCSMYFNICDTGRHCKDGASISIIKMFLSSDTALAHQKHDDFGFFIRKQNRRL
jgi:hypothetical protein